VCVREEREGEARSWGRGGGEEERREREENT
jgi:hypothetical protein